MNEKIRATWHKYYKPTWRVVTFLVAIVIMVIAFPNNTMMRYDYELNRPWQYNDLIAPYDFPVYKTDAELANERDSIVKNNPLYFVRREVDEAEVRSAVWSMVQQYKGKFKLICPVGVPTDTVQFYLSQRLTRALNTAYRRGVVDMPDNLIDVDPTNFELMLITGNVSEPCLLAEFLTIKEAYTKIVDQVSHELSLRFHAASNWPTTLLDRIPVTDLIHTNITYDKERTDAIVLEKLSQMSLTQGKVIAGQKIIGKGDMVNRTTLKVLDSLRRIREPQEANDHNWHLILGISLILLCLLTSVFTFMQFFRRDTFYQLHSVNFILLLMTVFVVFSAILSQNHANISFIFPYVILPIVLRIFLDSRLAMYVHTITVLIISFMVYNSQLFILLHIPAGMIAIVSLVNMTRRVQIVRTAGVVFLSYVTTYVGYTLWHTNDASEISATIILMLGTNSLLLLLSYPLIYVFERVFGFISDVTLVELSDTNSKLLRELSEKAPGTFQHSVQVANMAQAVAYKLKANSMLARAGAMYHDIGKLVSPLYFTENQAPGINPHDKLDYQESARIIIMHVENGIKLARRNGIPQPIINVIRSHHGNSQARFFYVKWCNDHPGEKPDIAAFTYPGPKPETMEEAIVMMADAVEASSKSLTSYTDENIDALVEKIVDMQVDSKQFENAPITFHDIAEAKRIFKEKLKNVYRSRIQYPELMK